MLQHCHKKKILIFFSTQSVWLVRNLKLQGSGSLHDKSPKTKIRTKNRKKNLYDKECQSFYGCVFLRATYTSFSKVKINQLLNQFLLPFVSLLQT